MMTMTSRSYFESVRRAKKRAEALEQTAELMNEHLGDAKGMRYDNVGGGHNKNGYTPCDAIIESVIRLEDAEKRALDAKEQALSLVSEAYSVLATMLEDDKADTVAIIIVRMYYLQGLSEEEIAEKVYKSRSSVAKIKHRGLRKAEPYLRRYSLI